MFLSGPTEVKNIWFHKNIGRNIPNNKQHSGFGLNNPNYAINMYEWLQDALDLLGLPFPAGYTFKTISVSGQSDVVADSVADTLTLVAGTGMAITTNATTDTITLTSTSAANSFSTIAVAGQSNVVADSSTDTLTLVGSGLTITTNATTDTITLTVPAATPQNLFSTVAVSGQSDIIADSATDTLTFASGAGITLTTNATTDTLTITNSAELFKTISVAGQSDIVADSLTDTLTIAAGSGITLTTNASTDTLTIAASGGSVDTIYTADGTIASNRTVSLDGKFLKFLNATAGLLDLSLNTDNLLAEVGEASTNDYGKILLSANGNGSLILMRNGAD